MTTPTEHAAAVLAVLADEATSANPEDWGGARARARDSLAALVALAERATELERERKVVGDLTSQEGRQAQNIKSLYQRATAAEARAEQLETALLTIKHHPDTPEHLRAFAARAALDGSPAPSRVEQLETALRQIERYEDGSKGVEHLSDIARAALDGGTATPPGPPFAPDCECRNPKGCMAMGECERGGTATPERDDV